MSKEATKRIPVERVGALPVDYYKAYVKFELLSDEELAAYKDKEGKALTEKQIIALKANAKPEPQFVKHVYLDEEALKVKEGLNDAQIAILQTEFTERELLSASGDEVQTVDAPSDPIGGSYTLSTGETVQVGKPEADKPAEPKRNKAKE